MKTKAIVKGNILWIEESINFKQREIEVEISDDYIQIEGESDGKAFLQSLWDSINELPESNVDWKKEWHKHLEEKYG